MEKEMENVPVEEKVQKPKKERVAKPKKEKVPKPKKEKAPKQPKSKKPKPPRAKGESGIALMKRLFNMWFILLWIAIYSFLATIYVYFISKSLVLSLILGVIGGYVFFYALNYTNKAVERRTGELKALNEYVTFVVFQLKTGKNVYQALEEALANISHPKIAKDIETALDSVRIHGNLELSQFKKYNFQALDVFHSNLMIKSTKGGKAKEIFKNTTQDMNNELNKRDELKIEKEFVLKQLWVMAVIGFGVPVIVSATSGAMYATFLAVKLVSYPLIVFFMVAMYITIYKMKKRYMDLSVSEI